MIDAGFVRYYRTVMHIMALNVRIRPREISRSRSPVVHKETKEALSLNWREPMAVEVNRVANATTVSGLARA